MLIMRTTENSAYPIRLLTCSQQPVRLDDLALAVYPPGLYGVEPRTLFWQKTAYDTHSGFAPTLFYTAVMFTKSAPDLFGACQEALVQMWS